MAVRAIALASSLLLPGVSAWGALGHEAIGYIAQDFVSSKTKTYVQKVLGDTSDNYMAQAATWADSYRSTDAGKWSAGLHYIDAQDSPPHSCGIDLDRDCGPDGCVVAAIANFTQQLLKKDTAKGDMLDAMKFVIHFVGDVHQPLHDENLEKGGNGIDVKYAGKDTNLHSVWDTAIAQAIANVDGSGLDDARKFATNTTALIKTGKLGAPASWVKGMNVTNAQAVALSWAKEGNAFVCTDVIPDGLQAVENQELSGKYFDAHSHVVQLQVARAGYRLAYWLDRIAATANHRF